MRVILTSIALALTVSTVYAADVVAVEDVAVIAPDTFSWTGGYVGINAGYAGGKFKTQFTDFNQDITINRSATRPDQLDGNWDDNANGFVGGVQAGYNWQFENGFLVGAEADFQGSTVKSKISGSDGDGIVSIYSDIKTKLDWWGTVRARVGYTPTERFLVYGTGGLAYGKVKTSYRFGVAFDGEEDFATGFSTSKTKAGWTIGGGAEYAITNNWTFKSEYLYTDLGKENTQATLRDFNGGGFGSTGDVSNHVKFHTVRVGLNYKF